MVFVLKALRVVRNGIVGILATNLAALIKINIIIGSHNAFFSGKAIAAPLLGAFGGVLYSVFVDSIRLCSHIITSGGCSFSILAYHIPGICAAWYWRSNSFVVRVALPLACMLAFALHPVGFTAFAYTFYWWIPILLYYLSRSSTFEIALGSSFIAHAVGSVIWLYTIPMSAQAWLALIPIVAFERLIMATSMAVIYSVVQYIRQQWALDTILILRHMRSFYHRF